MMLGFIVKLITHVAPAASDPPQSFPPEGLVVNKKSPEFIPLRTIVLIVSVTVEAVQTPPVDMLPLQSVTVCAELAVVTGKEPSKTVDGFTVPLHKKETAAAGPPA